LKVAGAYLPGLVFSIIGLVPFVVGAWIAMRRGAEVISWPEAEGVVTQSRVETKGSRHAARIRVRFESDDGVLEIEPAHDYRYGGYASAAEALERYPLNGAALVRYDPSDPRSARLEAGFNLATFGLPLVLLGAGAVFGGVGALALRSGRLSLTAVEAASADVAASARRGETRLVAGFVLGIGVLMAVGGAVLLPGALEVRGWPAVTGRVERSEIYTRTSSGSGKVKRTITTHVARLFLAYELEGRSFVTPHDAKSSQSKARIERFLASSPPGSSWPVRVNPQRPHRVIALDSWPLVLPAVLLGVGGLVSWLALMLFRGRWLAAPKRAVRR